MKPVRPDFKNAPPPAQKQRSNKKKKGPTGNDISDIQSICEPPSLNIHFSYFSPSQSLSLTYPLPLSFSFSLIHLNRRVIPLYVLLYVAGTRRRVLRSRRSKVWIFFLYFSVKLLRVHL